MLYEPQPAYALAEMPGLTGATPSTRCSISPPRAGRSTAESEAGARAGGAHTGVSRRRRPAHTRHRRVAGLWYRPCLNLLPSPPSSGRPHWPKAAQARKARAELKDHLKTGRTSLKELLGKADGNDTVGKMKVLAVLESLPGTGKVKARRLMEQVGISETRRLQGLGAKQREQLLEAVDRP